MNNFDFKKRNLFSGPHLFGTLLVIAGLFALISPAFLQSGSSMDRILAVGIGAIVVGLLVVSSYSGTLIDFDQNRFKEYVSVIGYKFGEWSALPDIAKVKVISTTYLSTNTPNGVSPTLSGKVTDYKTLVYTDSPKPFLSFVYSKRDKAINQARDLAHSLKVDLILDIPEEA